MYNIVSDKGTISIDSLSNDLNNIIGLTTVKKQLIDFYYYSNFIKMAKANNLKIPEGNFHMVFTGNPGTGKTMIARMVAHILYQIGVIKEDKLIEAERKDLVAEYLGQTATKTAELIKKAMGGVLFIDEAYSLKPNNEHDTYGDEAIATLIKAMEDNKGKFVVIFAGYKKEMRRFIDMNPGIQSRIGYTFHFDDYNEFELTDMFFLKMKNIGFNIKKSCSSEIISIMKYFKDLENFGNGRFVDRVIQTTILKHAKHIATSTADEVNKIRKKDLPTIDDLIEFMVDKEQMIQLEDISEDEIYRIAIHEMGHAIVKYFLTKNILIKRISVIPQANGTLGYVLSKSQSRTTETNIDLANNIICLLSGKNAEIVTFNNHSTGCYDDIKKAKSIAENMIEKYAMSSINSEDSKSIFLDCDTKSLNILTKYKDILIEFAKFLVQRKEMNEDEISKLFQKINTLNS